MSIYDNNIKMYTSSKVLFKNINLYNNPDEIIEKRKKLIHFCDVEKES